jgi:hypothetical protein
MNLTQLIGKLKPNERQRLEEMVKPRPIEPAKMKLGSVITDPSGQVRFIKMNEGWKTDFKVTDQQIVQHLVKPAVAKVVSEGLKRTAVGESYTLLSITLKEARIGNDKGKLTFERTAQGFVDPTFLSDEEMQQIVNGFRNWGDE